VPIPVPPPISADIEAILISNEALAVANVPVCPCHIKTLLVKLRKVSAWSCKLNIEADTTECVATLALAEAFKAFNWITVLPVVLIKFPICEPIPIIAPAWALFVIADRDALVSNSVILVPVSPPPN
jgi:hypothetical protein